MTQISEFQTKRAENIIWSCARNYRFNPDVKAFDRNGQADLYWNCIIGAVRYHYEYSKLEAVLHSFQEHEDDCDTYEGLLWLGLENAVFAREVMDRPVLSHLRQTYADAYVTQIAGNRNAVLRDDYNLLDALTLAHWLRVLGIEPKMSKYDIALLNELEFSPEDDTDLLVQKAQALFLRWFHILAEEKKHNRNFSFRLPAFGKKRRRSSSRYRNFGIGFWDHPEHVYSGGISAESGEKNELSTRLSEKELRAFMETKYGTSIFSTHRTLEIERTLCSGNHASCHLLFTGGEKVPLSQVQNGFEALARQREAAQIERNRKFYQNHLVRNKIAVSKLTAAIRNSVLLHLQPSPVRSNSGTLNGGLAWRAVQLNDDRVFTRMENDNMGDLSVDILLDASTSQQNRLETISSQGYIIAESLTQCGIPCRVMSFCSMTGYTIVRIFRDYNHPRDNAKIFEYVSNGCNRDGLAVRAAHHLMNDAPYTHRILIILSDVKPNDVVRMQSSGEEERIPYEKIPGLKDTALEVRRAQADNISVICIFTGDDEDLPSAKMVYGRDFVRIQSFDRLADTVGFLIQNQIRNL